MQNPLVSVIMPVYNAENYLDEAIQSILNQTFENFEFLIFNDCSNDNSWKIIQHYAVNDQRITAIDSEINRGYVYHLNEGINLAKGKYIARMDNDDISLPNRLEKQYHYMESNHDVVMCGTWFQAIGVRNDIVELPFENEHVRLQFLHNNVFCHPSVMIRIETLKTNNLSYLSKQMPSEDYLLWTSLAMFGNVVNLPEVLMQYRFHSQNFSNFAWKEGQHQMFKEAQIRYRKFFFRNLNISNESHELLHQFFDKKLGSNIDEVKKIVILLENIKEKYQNDTVSKERFNNYLNKLFFYLCTTSTHLGWKIIIVYAKSSLKIRSLRLNLKFIIKSILKK